ncbi:hypothetical protein [Frondihabitans australicus]|uniref:Uncharacterized protein n=1 Tax=Frondihabitans australicus TaxID=386892 RepID=A0A495IJ79_9MICO|nr:hypothetical protein [Frondihabitans australicus]RKR76033.1 hypothetical protein C8E83_3197 [Frondihabitans australicus]
MSTNPTRHERLRPLELLIMAAVFGLFTGLIVLMATRQPILSAIFCGVAFIVALVVLAMLSLAAKPSDAEQHEVTDANGRVKGLLEDRDDLPRGH